jgi:hypothetical protein
MQFKQGFDPGPIIAAESLDQQLLEAGAIDEGHFQLVVAQRAGAGDNRCLQPLHDLLIGCHALQMRAAFHVQGAFEYTFAAIRIGHNAGFDLEPLCPCG